MTDAGTGTTAAEKVASTESIMVGGFKTPYQAAVLEDVRHNRYVGTRAVVEVHSKYLLLKGQRGSLTVLLTSRFENETSVPELREVRDRFAREDVPCIRVVVPTSDEWRLTYPNVVERVADRFNRFPGTPTRNYEGMTFHAAVVDEDAESWDAPWQDEREQSSILDRIRAKIADATIDEVTECVSYAIEDLDASPDPAHPEDGLVAWMVHGEALAQDIHETPRSIADKFIEGGFIAEAKRATFEIDATKVVERIAEYAIRVIAEGRAAEARREEEEHAELVAEGGEGLIEFRALWAKVMGVETRISLHSGDEEYVMYEWAVERSGRDSEALLRSAFERGIRTEDELRSWLWDVVEVELHDIAEERIALRAESEVAA